MNTTRNFTPLFPSTQVFNNPFNRCQLISKLYSECRRKREEQRKSDGSWERSRSAVKPSESAEQNREKLPNCGMVGGCHTEGEAKKKTCSHLRGIGVLGGGNGGGVDGHGRHSHPRNVVHKNKKKSEGNQLMTERGGSIYGSAGWTLLGFSIALVSPFSRCVCPNR